MLAVDTLVRLRYPLEDDDQQLQKAPVLSQGSGPGLITDAVRVEAVWVLAGKR